MDNWYYASGSQREGPIARSELDRLVDEGVIGRNALVWREGMPDWTPYSSVSNPEASVGVCSLCGQPRPHRELVAIAGKSICSHCKPLFEQKLREGTRSEAPPAVLNYGGLGARLVASIIDTVIFYTALMVLVLVMTTSKLGVDEADNLTDSGTALFAAGFLGLTFLIEIWSVYKLGGSPGKLAVKLRIVRSNGSPLTFGRCVGRFFASRLSSLILGLGNLIAIFDGEKRTLHDHICDTRVVEKDPYAAVQELRLS